MKDEGNTHTNKLTKLAHNLTEVIWWAVLDGAVLVLKVKDRKFKKSRINWPPLVAIEDNSWTARQCYKWNYMFVWIRKSTFYFNFNKYKRQLPAFILIADNWANKTGKLFGLGENVYNFDYSPTVTKTGIWAWKLQQNEYLSSIWGAAKVR